MHRKRARFVDDHPPEEQLRAQRFNAEARDSVIEHFIDAVLPIYVRSEHERPEQIASCVLLDVGRKILITAAHATDPRPGCTLAVTGNPRLVDIEGEQFSSCFKKTRDDDKIDLSVIVLTDDCVQALGNVHWLTPQDFEPYDRCHLPIYITLGYPNSLNKPSQQAARGRGRVPSTYIGFTDDDADYSKQGFPKNSHIALGFDRKSIYDRAGKRTNPIAPQGKSGGVMFVVDFAEVHLPREQRSRPRLAAIIIERSPSRKLLLGTRVSVLQALIAAVVPQVADRLGPAAPDLDLNFVPN